MNWPNIDPLLPDLPLLFDSNAIRQRFEQQWPREWPREWTGESGTAASDVTVLTCRRQEINYRPATSCLATYSMTVKQADGVSWPTIGVVEVTPRGVNQRLFVADPALPGLAGAVDGQVMQERFNAFAGQGGQSSLIETCTATPIRYKPGARCTYRYDLRTAAGTASYFGKVVARHSAQLWATIVTLDQTSQQPTDAAIAQALPRIAPPVVYWPELQMVVQAAVAGAELHNAAFDKQFPEALRVDWLWAAGRSSAALHGLAGHGSPAAALFAELALPQPTLLDDLADLAGYCPAIRQANLGLADWFETVVAAITALSRQAREATPVLSHGALRTDQFMLAAGYRGNGVGRNDRLALIDLDGVCWANPARDLGNFLAYLTWKAMRQPDHAAFIQQAQQAFLAGYAALGALPDQEWINLYQAASLLKILGRRYTGLTVQEWPLTEQLLKQAVQLVQL